MYVARVLGRFPAEPLVTHAALDWDAVTHHATAVEDNAAYEMRREAAAGAGEACRGKLLSACTAFRLLAVAPGGLTSLVECRCGAAPCAALSDAASLLSHLVSGSGACVLLCAQATDGAEPPDPGTSAALRAPHRQ